MRIETGKKVFVVVRDGMRERVERGHIEAFTPEVVGIACADGYFRTRPLNRVYRTREEAADRATWSWPYPIRRHRFGVFRNLLKRDSRARVAGVPGETG